VNCGSRLRGYDQANKKSLPDFSDRRDLVTRGRFALEIEAIAVPLPLTANSIDPGIGPDLFQCLGGWKGLSRGAVGTGISCSTRCTTARRADVAMDEFTFDVAAAAAGIATTIVASPNADAFATSTGNRRFSSGTETAAVQASQESSRLPTEGAAFCRSTHPLIAAAWITNVWRRTDPLADVGSTTTFTAHHALFEMLKPIERTVGNHVAVRSVAVVTGFGAASRSATHWTTAAGGK
jgi:hypothetical protein